MRRACQYSTVQSAASVQVVTNLLFTDTLLFVLIMLLQFLVICWELSVVSEF